ncbi:unnamed protein product [Prunus brigantina]
MESKIVKEPRTVPTMRHSSPISSPGKGYDLQIIILFILELQNWLYFKSSFKFNKIGNIFRCYFWVSNSFLTS